MIIVCIAVIIIVMYFCCMKCKNTHTIFKYCLIEQSFETTHWLPHMTGQHATKKRQDHHKQTLHDSNNYLEKAEVKPDMKNFIATDHLATKHVHWRVVYNGKLRKINICVKGILHIINILLLYEHYVCNTPCQVHIKGF